MKNKLGIIGGLILSLVIAGSAFANTASTPLKTTNGPAKTKVIKLKNAKPRKHRKHRGAMKGTKKVAPKATTPSK
jgi:hypothetical protein